MSRVDMESKMRAFVSFSVGQGEDYVVTVLSFRLRAKNFKLSTSVKFFDEKLDDMTKCDIANAHLFVGVVVGDAAESARVYKEWRFATKQRIPNLLLVEDTAPLPKRFSGNVVRFNRLDPQPAIDEITARMCISEKTSTSVAENLVSWIWGGSALLGILSAVDGRH